MVNFSNARREFFVAVLSFSAMLGAVEFRLAEAAIYRWDNGKLITPRTAEPYGDFSSLDLSYANLVGANFYHSDMNQSNLSMAHLMQAVLEGVNLSGTVLDGAVLQGANVNWADFTGTTAGGFTAAQFYSTASYQLDTVGGVLLAENNLAGWNFAGKSVARISFVNSDLTGASFAGVTASTATDFSGADLTDADFTGAAIRHAIFADATTRGFSIDDLYSTTSYQKRDLGAIDLSGSDLTDWNLAGQQLRGAVFASAVLGGTDFTDTQVRGVDFSDTTYRGFTAAQLYGTASYETGYLREIRLGSNDLTGWNFAGMDLMEAEFPKAALNGVDFSGALLRDAVFSEATLTGADFTDAYVDNADFRDVTGFAAAQLYSTVDYQEGDLQRIILDGVDLRGWNFAGIDLQYASLARAQFDGADLTGALVTGTSFADVTARGFTAAQLYSTAGYVDENLRRIKLSNNDMAGWDFSGIGLYEAEFTGANLAGADLTDARCDKAVFDDATLTDAVLHNAELEYASFRNATLTGADLTDANVERADFSGTIARGFTAAQLYSTETYKTGNLRWLKLADNDLSGWTFAGKNVLGGDFQGSNLTSVSFRGADVFGAVFSGATLTDADFADAVIGNAILSDVTAGGFTAAQLYSTASYKSDNLGRIRMNENDMTGWNFAGKDLEDAQFMSSTLTGADFRGANLRETYFRDSKMDGADFSGARVSSMEGSGSDWTDANLRGTNFAWSDLSSATLRGADLTDAVIQSTDLSDTTSRGFTATQLYSTASYKDAVLLDVALAGNDLSGWDFTGISFNHAKFDGANATGAVFRDILSSNASFREAILIDADLRGAALYGGDFRRANLTGADLTDAIVSRADFSRATSWGFTAAQLYSTASYKSGDLNRIVLSHNDLSGLQAAGLDLTQAKMEESVLTGADFSGSTLKYLALTGATLTDANFSGAELWGTDFSGAALAGANLTDAILNNTNFSNTTAGGLTAAQLHTTATYKNGSLRNLRFGENDFTGWSFAGLDLGYSRFNDCILVGTDFRGANLASATFDDAEIRDADFTDVNLAGADFRRTTVIGGNFAGADLSGIECPLSTWSDVDFSGASFVGLEAEGATFAGVKFRGADLTDAELSGAVLADADFANATVTRVNLSGTTAGGLTASQLYATSDYKMGDLGRMGLSDNDLSGWNFAELELIETRFDGATLTGANFRGATLLRASLRETTLAGADFREAYLGLADLYHANLAGAKFTNATLPKVDLSEATSYGFTAEQLYSTADYRNGYLDYLQLNFNDLSGWNFAGKSLRHTSFRNATLTDANLRGANLNDASFRESTLTGADLRDTNLTDADFRSATLSGMDLRGADMTGANFSQARLAGANLSGTKLASASFYEADLTGASLTGADARGVSFFSVVIAGADFTDVEIAGADFSNTTVSGFSAEQFYSTANYKNNDLAGVVLSSNNLSGWNFAQRNLPGSVFENANLTGASFHGANLTGAELLSATLSGADLTDATVAAADLTGTIARGLTRAQLYSTASYKNGELMQIHFNGDSLADWDFDGVDLTESTFKGARLSNVSFQGATLTAAQFNNADLTDVSFDGADLTDGLVRYATLVNVSFRGAELSNVDFESTTGRSTDFREANMTGSNTYRADWRFANFNDANMTDATWYDSVLNSATFRNTDLTRARLQDSSLQSANFIGAILKNAYCRNADFTDADLSGADLSGAGFGSATLTRTNLKGADLTGADFWYATLSNTDFSDAIVAKAKFGRGDTGNLVAEQLYSTASYAAGDLRQIQLRGHDLSGWSFAEQGLQGANFGNCTLTGANFHRANLTGSDCTETTWTDADLREVDFTRANFGGADLAGTDLSGARLVKTNLMGATLAGANLSGASAPQVVIRNTSLAGANLAGADLSYAYASDDGADFSGADLRGAKLIDASGRKSDFTGANLSGADLSWGYWDEANLSGADFTGAVIKGVRFGSTQGFTSAQLYSTASYKNKELIGIGLSYDDLAEWNLAGQNLAGASFRDAVMTDVNLSGANLSRAGLEGDLSGVNLDGANLTGARVYRAENASFRGANLTNAECGNARLQGADFTDAIVVGANCYQVTSNGFTAAQLYSTASYKDGNLQGIRLLKNNLAGWDFAGKRLTDVDFESVTAGNADFSNADLADAAFFRAKLSGAKFQGANLTGADFEEADLSAARLNGAIIAGANFDSTSGLTAQQFYSTASYQQGDLQGIKLSEINLKDWDFSGKDLTGAYFGWAVLWNTNFSGAIIRGAKFSNNPFDSWPPQAFNADQFYSTASYRDGDLTHVGLFQRPDHLDLSGGNFSGMTLVEAWFSGPNLENADFSNADLTGAIITDAPGANFSGIVAPGARFESSSGADFSNALLQNTTILWSMEGADFHGSNMEGADFTRAFLTGANLRDCNLAGAQFHSSTGHYSAQLENADMTGAVVAGANFASTTGKGFAAEQLYSTASYQAGDLSGMKFDFNHLVGWSFADKDLTDTSFYYANLAGADFSGAVVTGVAFGGGLEYGPSSHSISAAQLYSTASYQAGDLSGISLVDDNLTGWDFSGQNLTGASFRQADLNGADFSGAVLRGTDFTVANLANVNFSGAIVCGTIFGKVDAYGGSSSTPISPEQLYSTASYQSKDLREISLEEHGLQGWDFSGQDLTGASFRKTSLTGTDFRGADLTGADFYKARLADVEFAGAIVDGAHFWTSEGYFQPEQLYSTASYEAGDLRGISLDGNLGGWDFSGQDLTGASFDRANLFGADFTDAIVVDAVFDWTARDDLFRERLAAEQFYATASYQAGVLRGISMNGNRLAGWSFAGQDLTGASFRDSDLRSVDFTGATLTGVDFDGATLPLRMPSLPIIPDATVTLGHDLTVDDVLRIDEGGTLTTDRTLSVYGRVVNNGLIDTAGRLLFFEGPVSGGGDTTGYVVFTAGYSPGESSAATMHENISFEADNVLLMELAGPSPEDGYDRLIVSGAAALDGTLEITTIDGFLPDVGDTFDLFDWTLVSGTFRDVSTPSWLELDTSDLYAGGTVEVLAIPEPSTFALAVAGLLGLSGCLWRRHRTRQASPAAEARGKRANRTVAGVPISVCLVGILLFAGHSAEAGVWQNFDAGDWSDPVNWTGGVPDGPGDVATFGQAYPARSGAITIDGEVRVGTIESLNENVLSLAGTGSLVMDAADNGQAELRLHADANMIRIYNDLAVAAGDDLLVDVAAGAEVQLNALFDPGAATVTKTGEGQLTITESSAAWTGPLDVLGGTVEVLDAGALGSAAGETLLRTGGTLAIARNVGLGAEPVVLDGGTLAGPATGTATFTGPVELRSAGTLLSEGNGLLRVNGPIHGAGDLTVTGNRVEFNAANTYTGDVRITAADLLVKHEQALGNPSGRTIAATGGVLRLGFPTVSQRTIALDGGRLQPGSFGTTTLAGPLELLSGGILTAGSSSRTLEISGPITGPGGVTLQNGTFELSGENTYAGHTTISAATVTLSDGAAFGAGTGRDIDGTTLRAGAVLKLPGGSAGSIKESEKLILDGASIIGGPVNGPVELVAGSANVLDGTGVGGVISGGGDVVVKSATFSGDNTYTGHTTLHGDHLYIHHANGLGSPEEGTTVIDGVLGLGAATAEPLLVQGGSVALSEYTYDNPITISGGILAADSDIEAVLSCPLALSDGGEVGIHPNSRSTLRLNGGVEGSGDLLLTSGGRTVFGGPLTFDGDIVVEGSADATFDSSDVAFSGKLRVTAFSVYTSPSIDIDQNMTLRLELDAAYLNVASGKTLTSADSDLEIRHGSIDGTLAGVERFHVLGRHSVGFKDIGFDNEAVVLVERGSLSASSGGLGSTAVGTYVASPQNAEIRVATTEPVEEPLFLQDASGFSHKGALVLEMNYRDYEALFTGPIHLGNRGAVIGFDGKGRISGPISGGNLDLACSGGTLTIAGGGHTYTGRTWIRPAGTGGTVTLQKNGKFETTSSVIIERSTLKLDNKSHRFHADRIADHIPVVFRGGTLEFTGNDSGFPVAGPATETVGVVTAESSRSRVLISAGDADETVLTLIELRRMPGATLEFPPDIGTEPSGYEKTTQLLISSNPTLQHGLIGPWAFAERSGGQGEDFDFVTYDPAVGVHLLNREGRPGDLNTALPTDNVRLDAKASALSSDATAHSLVMDSSQWDYSDRNELMTLDLGGHTLNVVGGGVLTSGGSGAKTIKNGTLTAGGNSPDAELVVTNSMTIDADIVDNPGGPVGLTVARGSVAIRGKNTYSGPTYISGKLYVRSYDSFPEGADVIIDGGELRFDSSPIDAVSMGTLTIRGDGTIGGDSLLRLRPERVELEDGYLGYLDGDTPVFKTGPWSAEIYVRSSFTGPIVIEQGTVHTGRRDENTLGTGTVTIHRGGKLNVGNENYATFCNPVTLAGGTLSTSSDYTQITGPVTVVADSELCVVGWAHELRGRLSGDHTLKIVNNVAGYWTDSKNGALKILSDNRSFSGLLDIEDVSVTALSRYALGSNGAVLRKFGNLYVETPLLEGNVTLDGGRFAAVEGSRTLSGNVRIRSDSQIGGEHNLTINGGLTLADGAMLEKTDPGTLTVKSYLEVGRDSVLDVDGGQVVLRGVLRAAGPNASLRFPSLTNVTFDQSIRVDSDRSLTVSVAREPMTLRFDSPSQSVSGGGTLHNELVLSGGATLRPGNSPGTMTVTKDVTLAAGGIYEWEINDADGAAGTDTGWDLLRVEGVLAVESGNASPVTIRLLSLSENGTAGALAHFDPQRSYRWTIARADLVAGFDSASFDIDALGFLLHNPVALDGEFFLQHTGGDLVVTYVPEPGTLVMLLGGLLGIIGTTRYLKRRCR